MKSTADFILPAIALSSGISVLLIGLTSIVIILFASHKIAGPLYRLEKDVQEITAGNLKIVFRLREGDELKALVGSMNDMTNTLHDRIAEAKNYLEEVQTSSGLQPEVRQKAKLAREALEKFKT